MKVRRAGTAVLAAVAMTAVLLPPAQADHDLKERKRAADAAIRELDGQVDATTAKVNAATRSLADAEAKLAPAEAALAAAQAAVGAAQADQDDAAQRLAATLAEAERARADLAETEDSIQGHQEAIGAMARAAYMGGDLQRLAVLMDSRSPEELTSAMAYLGSVNRSERVILDDLGEQRRDLAMKQARLEALRLRTLDERAAATAAVEKTSAARDGAAAASDEVEDLIDLRETALAAAAEVKAEVEKRLAEQQAESARLARVIQERAEAARRAAERARERARERGEPAPLPSSNGLMQRPVIGPITSSYGMRYHPILRTYKLHTGTDFGAPAGTSVRSALGGRVLESYYNGAYGNRVVVEHGIVRGVYLVTTYNHLSRRSVSVGERLDRGEVLGNVGSTGYSTGPHLHFETLNDGRFVNPMTWLN